MPRTERWDAIIIGSGAGGGALAFSLSRSGFQVLVLEKGPRYSRDEYLHDEVLTTIRPDFFVPRLEDEPHILVDRRDGTGVPRRTKLGWLACCVGGGTVRMGASSYRLHPDDFRVRSRFGPLEAVEDWPYTYEELEPYYVRAERDLGVSGMDGCTPFEGYRSRAYPMPPLASHPLGAQLDQSARRLGLHPFPTPRAINSRPYAGRPGCAYCRFCAGFGCPVGARGTTQETLIARAERTGRCDVRPNSMVRKITVDRHGFATGCIYIDRVGREHSVLGSVICVCCSAVESARLLLLSTSPRFPQGLGNEHGLVGKHLQFKIATTAKGRFKIESSWSSKRYPFLGRSIADYLRLPNSAADYAKGGLLRYDMERVQPIRSAQRVALGTDGRLSWGEPLKRRLAHHLRDCCEVEFEVFQDFLPNAGTYVELDPQVTDRWGLPVARIHLGHPDHHAQAAQWLLDRGLEILSEMGAEDLVIGGVGHINPYLVQGTCRAGTDPASSVLDGFCRTHTVPNLFVVDGSFMPTSGAAPSTLTIVANGFRTADFIIDRARTGEFTPGFVHSQEPERQRVAGATTFNPSAGGSND